MPRTGRSFDVEAEIEALIRSGEWPIGHRLGTFSEMAEHFRCARSSMHRAIVSLRDRGILRIERDPARVPPAGRIVVIGLGDGAADRK